MNNKRFYLTTTLPYVNAEPHIGHALEFIQADTYARYFRKKLGKENVFFNLGTDEHGLKVLKQARQKEIPVEEFVEQTAQRFKDFCKLFFIDYDFFYQTSHDYHVKPAQAFWLACLQNGDIYKGKYEGYYCVGCEYYKTEKDLVDGKCPLHNTEPIWVSEENYFFRLSKYADVLLDYFTKNPDFIKPKSKLVEAKNFVKHGLTDISISRRKENLPWGIEVPNDPDHVMYVWFDALTDFVGAVGYATNDEEFKKWWPVTQLCGPDNLRFQAIIWQGMLASAGLPFSKKILVHSTILGFDGHKMSKTIGNVVSPFVQVEKFNAEIVRYYLLAGLPTYTDASYKEEDLISLYNANLANNYGNLLNRILVLGKNKEVAYDETKAHKDIQKVTDTYKKDVDKLYESFDIYTACNKINELLTFGNKYIDEQKPWTKSGEELETILSNLALIVSTATELYEPILPESTQRAKEALASKTPIILYTKLEQTTE